MERAEHLQSANNFLAAARLLADMPQQGQATAEMVWGATVAARSAADPEHNISHHDAPYNRRNFRQAAHRIANPNLTFAELEHCLDNNQRLLHTHFYHGNLHYDDLNPNVEVGKNLVMQILAIAQQDLP